MLCPAFVSVFTLHFLCSKYLVAPHSFSGVSFRPAWEPHFAVRFQIYGNILSLALNHKATFVGQEVLDTKRKKYGRCKVEGAAKRIVGRHLIVNGLVVSEDILIQISYSLKSINTLALVYCRIRRLEVTGSHVSLSGQPKRTLLYELVLNMPAYKIGNPSRTRLFSPLLFTSNISCTPSRIKSSIPSRATLAFATMKIPASSSIFLATLAISSSSSCLAAPAGDPSQLTPAASSSHISSIPSPSASAQHAGDRFEEGPDDFRLGHGMFRANTFSVLVNVSC